MLRNIAISLAEPLTGDGMLNRLGAYQDALRLAASVQAAAPTLPRRAIFSPNGSRRRHHNGAAAAARALSAHGCTPRVPNSCVNFIFTPNLVSLEPAATHTLAIPSVRGVEDYAPLGRIPHSATGRWRFTLNISPQPASTLSYANAPRARQLLTPHRKACRCEDSNCC
jgi:hypothetical protein